MQAGTTVTVWAAPFIDFPPMARLDGQQGEIVSGPVAAHLTQWGTGELPVEIAAEAPVYYVRVGLGIREIPGIALRTEGGN